MHQKCNRLDTSATPSRHDPDMVLYEACYGKSVAQVTVGTASACVRMPPRENQIILDLGLLSLCIEAFRHVLFTEFGIEFFRA
jgi:hypothetical protein